MDDLLPVALPVGDKTHNLSDNEEKHDRAPTSAEEYLMRVRSEARKTPDVVVAHFNRESLRNKQTVVVSNSTGFSPAPRGFAPCIDWQHHQATSFSDLRQRLVRAKARMAAEGKDEMNLPRYRDEDAWCQFCYGRAFLDRLKTKQGRPSTEGRVDESAAGGSPIPPLISVISCLDQAMVQKLLEYQVDWIETLGFSLAQGCWLYALLACLEKPLLADSTATIRTLSRHCATLRAVLDSNTEENLASLNLLISIIARYFDQTDLADKG